MRNQIDQQTHGYYQNQNYQDIITIRYYNLIVKFKFKFNGIKKEEEYYSAIIIGY